MPLAFSGMCTYAGRLSQIGAARFARKYPAVMDALLRALLELICKYYRTIMGYGPCCQPLTLDLIPHNHRASILWQARRQTGNKYDSICKIAQ